MNRRKKLALCLFLFLLLICGAAMSKPGPVHATAYGMFYLIWHCPVATPDPPDIHEALYGLGSWGSIPGFHWWDKPQNGYYCLAQNDLLLQQHAIQLRDAGIDFVYVDVTNWPNTTQFNAQAQIMDPFPNLLQVWNTVPNAPKIVPWVIATTNGNMIDWILGQMASYPNLTYTYQGKPLLLIVDNSTYPPDPNRLATLSNSWTIRKMWGLYDTIPLGNWSFIQRCNPEVEFRQSGATIPCNQALGLAPNGTVEAVAMTTAYQHWFVSDKTNATAKFYGRTLRRQFETLLANPSAPIALFTGWNEWIAQRFCLDINGLPAATGCTTENDHLPDGNKIFVDSYDLEYNRDIEPGQNEMGSYYYELVKACINLKETGQTCSGGNAANNLCCKNYWGWDFGTPLNPTNDGWVATNHLTPETTANGLWQSTITGADPFLIYNTTVNYPAATTDRINIRMKVSSGGDAQGQLYWTTSGSPSFGADKVVAFIVHGDNLWHEYTLDSAAFTNWTGTIQQLRLDPGSNNSGAVVSLDWIRLSLASGQIPYSGDTDGDWDVDLTDFNTVKNAHDTNNAAADVNDDGLVNIFDIGIVVTNYNP